MKKLLFTFAFLLITVASFAEWDSKTFIPLGRHVTPEQGQTDLLILKYSGPEYPFDIISVVDIGIHYLVQQLYVIQNNKPLCTQYNVLEIVSRKWELKDLITILKAKTASGKVWSLHYRTEGNPKLELTVDSKLQSWTIIHAEGGLMKLTQDYERELFCPPFGFISENCCPDEEEGYCDAYAWRFTMINIFSVANPPRVDETLRIKKTLVTPNGGRRTMEAELVRNGVKMTVIDAFGETVYYRVGTGSNFAAQACEIYMSAEGKLVGYSRGGCNGLGGGRGDCVNFKIMEEVHNSNDRDVYYTVTYNK
jgi:hypothetical protein